MARDRNGDMARSPARPRLIATDLDGTLLRTDGTISKRTATVLQRARASGIEILMVTGRPPRHVRAIDGARELGGLAICINGALLYDLDRDAVVDEMRLPASVARDIVVSLRARVPGISFAVEVGLEYGWEPSYATHRLKREPAPLPASDALKLCEQGANKLIAFHPDLKLEDFIAGAPEIITEQASLTYSGAPFLEIGARGVSKASALTTYCAQRSINKADVIAFGDMPNDLPMLSWAGRGIAMANGHATVRAATTEIALSNDEDGVAVVLEHLL